MARQLPHPGRGRCSAPGIEFAAEAAGRTIEPDHYGISLAVGDGELPAELLAAVRRRRPDVDPAELVAADWPDLHRQIDGYLAAGLTKFVIRAAGPTDRAAFLDRFTTELLPRQN